jgi:hypothetical protein
MKACVLTHNLNFSTRTKNEFQKFEWTCRFDLVKKTIDLAIGSDPDALQKTILCFQEALEEYFPVLDEWFLPTHDRYHHCISEKKVHVVTYVPRNWSSRRLHVPELVGAPIQSFLAVMVGGTQVVNCHLSMDETERNSAADHLQNRVLDLNAPRIVCGDVNAMVDKTGPDMINRITAGCAMADLTHIMFNESGQRQLMTFRPFEYDKIPGGLPPYGLDHIFASAECLPPPGKYPLCIAEYRPLLVRGQAYTASDHFCICAEVTLQ